MAKRDRLLLRSFSAVNRATVLALSLPRRSRRSSFQRPSLGPGNEPMAFPASWRPETRATTRKSPAVSHDRVRAAPTRESVLGEPTADIEVTYHGFLDNGTIGFPGGRRVETLIVSSQTIHADATDIVAERRARSGFDRRLLYLGADDYVYPVALYEAACDCESSAGTGDPGAVQQRVFGSWHWARTVTRRPTSNFSRLSCTRSATDWASRGSQSREGGLGYWGFSDGFDSYPLRYDSYEWSGLQTGAARSWTSYVPGGAVGLKNELVDVAFSEARGGQRGRSTDQALRNPTRGAAAPATPHLDEVISPARSLMTPALSNANRSTPSW